MLAMALAGCAANPKPSVRRTAGLPPVPWLPAVESDIRASAVIVPPTPPALVTNLSLEWDQTDPRPSIRYVVKWTNRIGAAISNWPTMTFADETNRVKIPPFTPPMFWSVGAMWIPGYLP